MEILFSVLSVMPEKMPRGILQPEVSRPQGFFGSPYLSIQTFFMPPW